MSEFNPISEEEKKKITEALNSKGVKPVCPMCGNRKFVIADGYFNNSIQTELIDAMVLGGPAIPTIAIFCTNCGFTSQHALGALDLLPKKGENKK